MQNLRWILVVLTFLMGACSPWPNPAPRDTSDNLGIDDGTSHGDETSRAITGKEEVVLELKTGAQVKIPKGAVDKEVTITLKRPPDTEAVKLVENLGYQYELASAPYVITPHGTKFKKDVEVTLPIARGRDPNQLKVLWRKDEDDTAWRELTTPNVDKQKATVKVDHFSLFVLVEVRSDDGFSGDYGDGDGFMSGDGDGPASTPTFVEAIIGPAGGTLELTTGAGLAKLVVPPGAVAQSLVLRLEKLVSLTDSPFPGGIWPSPDLGQGGFIGFVRVGATFAVKPDMLFAVPVTLQLPLAEGEDRLVRTIPGHVGWYLPPRASVQAAQASLETRRSGTFAVTSSQTSGVDLESLMAPALRCLLKRSDSLTTSSCEFVSTCSVGMGCTEAGTCTCYGGAVGQATFQGSCANGVDSLAVTATDACEWFGTVPFIPENQWWEISSAADTSACAPGSDLNAGSYAWTGADGYNFNRTWTWSNFFIDARNIVASTGARVDVFEDECLQYQRTDDTPCPDPVGLVEGTPTRITLAEESHDSDYVRLSFQTNGKRGLPPDSFIERWDLSCSRSFPEPLTTAWECRCDRLHVNRGPDHVSSTIPDSEAGFDAAQRVARGTGTAVDMLTLIDGCGWPRVEVLPSRKYTRPPSGTTLPGTMPVCFTP